HGFNYTPVNLESQYSPPAGTGSGATITTYAYNLDKQLTTATRPDGKIVSYSYDTAGRLIGIVSPDGSLNYTYSANGCPSCSGGEMPQSVASAIGGVNQTINYIYDGAPLTSATWSGAINGSVSWTYNNDMLPITQSVNGANTVNFGYDNDGNLISAGAMTITRDAGNGNITATTLGSATTSATYTAYGELATSIAKHSANTLLNVAYTRDNLGRITRKVETVQGVATTYDYQYDQAGRLIGVSKNGSAVSSYVYDNNGNRVTSTVNGVVTQGFYDLQDRLLTYGNNSYTYTANGELLTKSSASGTTTYNYDVMGNLVSVAMPDGTIIEYVIDGQNRRVGKKVNGVLVQGWLYKDQLEPIAELDGAGNVIATFIYGTKGHSPDYMVKSGVTYRVISDHLGSPKMIVDIATGAIAQQIDYDEWGNIVSDTNSGFQPFGYVAGIYDSHTKLTRFGARDYDAETGRWTSKDMMRFEGNSYNLYDYALNDPVNNIDKAGLEAKRIHPSPIIFPNLYCKCNEVSGLELIGLEVYTKSGQAEESCRCVYKLKCSDGDIKIYGPMQPLICNGCGLQPSGLQG
ncbi:MAG: RHS repeat-associated core domain-containing protein, partial [Nitrospinae bacterium]|nr:RHS repeat-associated core domain-containing protein [Nitrospinota bacterium]